MLTQISHNRIGEITLSPLDADQCVRTTLCLRSAQTAAVFLGNITVLEYGSDDGPFVDYSYRLGPAVSLQHTHDNEGLFMMIMLEGRLVIEQGLDEDSTLAEGIVCLFRSRQYTISLPEESAARYLLFEMSALADRLNLQGFEPGRYPLTDIMQAQVYEVLHPPVKLADPQEWLSGQLIGMLYQMKECMGLELRLRNKLYHQDYALAADLFIRRNLVRDLTTKEISRHVCLNECDLKKAFGQYFGCGLAKRQNRLRIQKAMQLMQQTTKQIQEIAAECGYKSTKTLYNNFRPETKQTPIEWRKKYSI